MDIKIGTGLNCGCCGNWFKTWDGYEDQDQDSEYGICFECQGDIEERSEKEYDKLIACVKSGLTPDRLEHYNELDRDIQKNFALSCLNQGFVVVTFGKEIS